MLVLQIFQVCDNKLKLFGFFHGMMIACVHFMSISLISAIKKQHSFFELQVEGFLGQIVMQQPD
jgi:hypothetical protein